MFVDMSTQLGYKGLQVVSRSLGVLLVSLCVLNVTPHATVAAIQAQAEQLLDQAAIADVKPASSDEVATSADAAPALQQRPTTSQTKAAQKAGAFNSLAREVILEVFDLVDNNYLDARNSGFDRAKWARIRDEALTRTYRDEGSLQRAIRDMLAKGCNDPYTRYISPLDFSSIVKYDVSGVGLNLGSPDDYVKKARKVLPPGRDKVKGVYVVGLISRSEADVRGIEQGDEIMEVQGNKVADGEAAFQVSSGALSSLWLNNTSARLDGRWGKFRLPFLLTAYLNHSQSDRHPACRSTRSVSRLHSYNSGHVCDSVTCNLRQKQLRTCSNNSKDSVNIKKTSLNIFC